LKLKYEDVIRYLYIKAYRLKVYLLGIVAQFVVSTVAWAKVAAENAAVQAARSVTPEQYKRMPTHARLELAKFLSTERIGHLSSGISFGTPFTVANAVEYNEQLWRDRTLE
jgi:hypothetical protein